MSLEPEVAKTIIKGITIAFGGMLPAWAIGKTASQAMEAIGRNPEAADKLFVPMLLGMAFAEAIAIYALVITFIL
jgi:F-type H+-transporting ATPase subunit c